MVWGVVSPGCKREQLTCNFSHLRVYTLILTGVDLADPRGSVPPLVATLAVAYNIIQMTKVHSIKFRHLLLMKVGFVVDY